MFPLKKKKNRIGKLLDGQFRVQSGKGEEASMPETEVYALKQISKNKPIQTNPGIVVKGTPVTNEVSRPQLLELEDLPRSSSSFLFCDSF